MKSTQNCRPDRLEVQHGGGLCQGLVVSSMAANANINCTSFSRTSFTAIGVGQKGSQTTHPGGVGMLCSTPCTFPGASRNTSG